MARKRNKYDISIESEFEEDRLYNFIALPSNFIIPTFHYNTSVWRFLYNIETLNSNYEYIKYSGRNGF